MQNNTAVLAPESRSVAECLDRLASRKHAARPLSTYRLQFRSGFRFEDAQRLAGYLHALGISHIYSSPIQKARPGSMHGYDITDHNQLNPEIGSYEELQALVRELRNYGMGMVLDLVPNHIAIGQETNPWWQDVLANGRSSEYADFFDIDWNPPKAELRNKLLLPILGDQYGAELEAGRIRLVQEDGDFHVQYQENQLPVDPQTIPLVFEPVLEITTLQPRDGQAPDEPDIGELHTLLEKLHALPPHNVTAGHLLMQRRQAIPQLLKHLRDLVKTSLPVRNFIEKAIEQSNGHPGEARSFDGLHRLLEAQVYRLANWRVSGEE